MQEAVEAQPASAVRGDEIDTSGPKLAAGYERIQDRIFSLPDPEAEYAELQAGLQVGNQQFDSIFSALDRAEDNARRAHRLYICARVDAERFALDADVTEGGLWAAANADLQREKDSGARTKQITDADVRARIASMFPDQWTELQQRRIKARKTVEHLERFADLAKTRCFSLANMLATKR
jgi:hypothetical protein